MALRIRAEEDESSIGWVSMTDIFLLTTVLMLVMSIFVQFRFDRYKDRAAITQEQVSALHQQITSLKGENEPLHVEVQRLEAQITESEAQTRAAQERIAALHQKIEHLRQSNETMQAEAQEMTEYEKRSADLKTQLQEKEKQLQQLQDRLVEASEESMLRVPLSARLVLRVWASLPEDFDIDLFVQDPHNRICFYRNPSIFEADVEVATMQLSEYLRKRPSGYIEEAYYSDRFIPSEKGEEDSYLAFVIIRNERTGKAQKLDHPVQVNYEVLVRDDNGRTVAGRSQRGTARINLAGWSQVGGKGRVGFLNSLFSENGPDFKFLNLYALFGFYSTESGRFSTIEHRDPNLPSVPRGFHVVDSGSVQGSGDRRLLD